MQRTLRIEGVTHVYGVLAVVERAGAAAEAAAENAAALARRIRLHDCRRGVSSQSDIAARSGRLATG